MSWQITISDDPDSTGEKTVSATWTEATGSPPAVFSYSIRANQTPGAANAFVAAAIAARNAWQAKRVTIAAQTAALRTKFTAADPQAGG